MSNKEVDRLKQPRIAATVIFLSTEACIAAMLVKVYPYFSLYYAAVALSPIVFAAAAVMLFFRPTAGYVLGAVAALMALP